MNKQLIVGLTGGIGAGKTTISKIFTALGVPVFNSDEEAKTIVNQDNTVVTSIKETFGNVYVGGRLDSKKMAELVFNDPEALNKLNHIVHPKVKKTFAKWIERNKNEKILIKEAAILIETNNYKELDKTILVVAPVSIRQKRVIKRDGVDSIAFKNRMKSQLSDTEKEKVADFIIHNDDEQLLIPQVLKIHKELIQLLVQ